MTGEHPRILYCHCAYARIVPVEVKQEVLTKLAESGRSFDAVPDLCEMSARRDPQLSEFAATDNVRIAACYPRAVKWLFAAAGSPLAAKGAEVLNMREQSPETIVNSLLGVGS
jgi:heterodisulfide reductase subunit A-like polyferredoxin